MTVLQACQSAAIRLIGRKPDVIFSSTDTFELELQDIANEAAADIAKSADWQALIRIAVLVGDGFSESFPFPSDYGRMPVHADILDSVNFAWGYKRITDLNHFLYIKQSGLQALPGNWTIYGDRFQFVPPPTSGAEAEFPYIDRNYATDTNGTPKAAFDLDNDIFRLSERLLTLAMIWRWRQNKRLDHGEDLANFEKAMNEEMGRDRGSRIFATGPARMPGNVSPSYPWALGP